jgi:hypothetical protein
MGFAPAVQTAIEKLRVTLLGSGATATLKRQDPVTGMVDVRVMTSHFVYQGDGPGAMKMRVVEGLAATVAQLNQATHCETAGTLWRIVESPPATDVSGVRTMLLEGVRS